MDIDILNETITPINSTLLTLGGTGAMGLPIGTTAQRPGSAATGAMRWNTSLSIVEFFNGTTWNSNSGSVTSVAISGGTTGLTTSGGPITSAGTITLAGTLAIANGGTGQITAAAAYNALSPMTTTGDLEYEASAGTAARLAIGTSGQVLTVTSGLPSWATVGTASFSVLVGPSGTIAWSLVSGTTYTATITHNLGTQNVVVQMADIATNNVVQPGLITINSSTQTTVQVTGNTKTLRVVIIANGASIAAGASTPSSVLVNANGVAVSGGPFTTLNITGYTTAPTGASGTATINLGATIRTLTWFATSLDSPNNADWAVNALAPTVADPTNSAINTRQFSGTIEQGVGMLVPIPLGATNVTFTYRGRAQTAPGAAATLQINLYFRTIASVTPAAVSAWSGALGLASVTVPTNAFYQTYTQSSTLVAAGLTAGNQYQFEFTRNIAVGGNLSGNWLMDEFTLSFS